MMLKKVGDGGCIRPNLPHLMHGVLFALKKGRHQSQPFFLKNPNKNTDTPINTAHKAG